MPTFKGETVEQAIETGLKSLQISRVDADIQIVEEGKKGFLGIGRKEAVVNVVAKQQEAPLVEEAKQEAVIKGTPKTEKNESNSEKLSDEQVIESLKDYLLSITKELHALTKIDVSKEDGRYVLQLETEKKGLLIGKHGKTLNALQYLSQVYVHRLAQNRVSVVLNVGNYRERRETIIKRLSQQTLKQVRETGQPVFLEPMPAFERKQVHSILSTEKDIKTHSEGNEPHRYLVVELNK